MRKISYKYSISVLDQNGVPTSTTEVVAKTRNNAVYKVCKLLGISFPGVSMKTKKFKGVEVTCLGEA